MPLLMNVLRVFSGRIALLLSGGLGFFVGGGVSGVGKIVRWGVLGVAVYYGWQWLNKNKGI